MLIVISTNKKRAAASVLSNDFDGVYRRCMIDPSYCLKPAPELAQAAPGQLVRVTTGVEVPLSQKASTLFNQNRSRISSYAGEKVYQAPDMSMVY
jgi:hypothetical protein